MLAIARVGGERVYVPTHRDEAAMGHPAFLLCMWLCMCKWVKNKCEGGMVPGLRLTSA